MISRYVILPAVLLVAFVSGCAVPGDAPDGTEPAPAPRPKMTTAELLVGTWKFVKRTPPKAKGNESTFEYTKDGKVTLRKFHPQDGEEIQAGTYRIEGGTLFLMMDTEPTERNVTVESITEDKLVISGFSGSTRMVSEYERVPGKK